VNTTIDRVDLRDVTCLRCHGPAHLTVRVRHPQMPGHRVLTLCPTCDQGNPDAYLLLAFFAAFPQPPVHEAAELIALIRLWLRAQPEPHGVDVATLEVDIEAWRQGAFDG
jgi:hypothetical protein